MFDDESKKILEDSIPFWNETERVLKRTEQLRDEVVIPAISELRYAGRKLVDFVMSRLNGEDLDASRKHIYDYEQCCIRARHDAVDAAVMYMKKYYSILVEQFGVDAVQDSYQYHAELRKAFRVVEQRVLLSREERHRRVDLYAEINHTSFDDLIAKFEELQDSTEVIAAIRTSRDRSHRVAVGIFWVGVGGIVITIVSFVITTILPLLRH